jgi:uncharacterized protein YbjT (DUF2867 family)
VIVVTAAGGQTGAAVVRALWSQGRQVRAVVGGSRPHPELAALAGDLAVADLRDVAAVEPLLDGADALYLVVYHSVLRPQVRSMPHHAAKDRVEEALDTSGLPWRVLQPCAYADNLDGQFAEAASTGLFRSPWGLARAQSLVDLRDVADAAVALLTQGGLDGGTFEAAGPEPLTAPQIAELFAVRLGREVTAVDAAPDGPVPDEYAARCRRLMFDHYRAHGFTGSPRVLEALLGRPARTFAEHLAALALPPTEDAGERV